METSYEPLYQKIYNDIREKIKSGALPLGTKVPTEFELMEQYSVSRITTARALKELANDGYIQRTRKNGSTVIATDGESPAPPEERPREAVAPSAVYEHIPLLMPFSASQFDILSSIQREAQNSHYLITLFNSEKRLDREREILDQISRMNIGGLICLPIESYQNLSLYTKLQAQKIPIVFMDRQLPYIDIPYVSTNNYDAMYNLTQWLINQGHKRIAFYCHDLNTHNELLRFKGYIAALTDNGIQLNSQFVAELKKNDVEDIMLRENNPDAAHRVNQYLKDIMALEAPPTALICAFDLLASYVEQQANLLKISIPDDLSLTGFDNSSLCSHLEIPLTSVAQNYEAIGKKVIELMNALRSGQPVQSEYLMSSSIVERASVRKLSQ